MDEDAGQRAIFCWKAGRMVAQTTCTYMCVSIQSSPGKLFVDDAYVLRMLIFPPLFSTIYVCKMVDKCLRPPKGTFFG